MAEEKPRLKRHDDRDDPSTAERVLMALSAAVALVVFGYLAWQAVAAPEAVAPRAELVQVETTPEGDVRVTVAVVNDGEQGYREVEVEVKCGDPPASLTFQNVPAHGRRVGTAVCPPGTTAPEVSVSHWLET